MEPQTDKILFKELNLGLWIKSSENLFSVIICPDSCSPSLWLCFYLHLLVAKFLYILPLILPFCPLDMELRTWPGFLHSQTFLPVPKCDLSQFGTHRAKNRTRSVDRNGIFQKLEKETNLARVSKLVYWQNDN